MSAGQSIYHTDFAAVMPRFSGFTSAISSIIIIHVILRSVNRLSTIYHRIMVCMALSDMMSSIAIGLTTLPMPKGALLYGTPISIAGTRLGNNGTCAAQGFFYTFGLVTGLTYYAVLTVYYACAIALRMEESRIKKYVEPWLHVVPLTLGLTASVPPLIHRLYYVSSYEAWCAFTPYPINIDLDEYADFGSESFFEIAIGSAVCISFTTIVVSLIAVICRVRHTERIIQRQFKEHIRRNQHVSVLASASASALPSREGSEHRGNGSTNISVGNNGHDDDDNNDHARDSSRAYEHVLRAHQSIKDITIQSIAYIVIYVSVLFWPIMTLTVKKEIFTHLFLAVFPLQGFFNMVIFLGHKVHSHCRLDPSLSYMKVLSRLLWESSPSDPVYVYRLSIVEETLNARGNLEALGIEIHSEFGQQQYQHHGDDHNGECESDLSISSGSSDGDEAMNTNINMNMNMNMNMDANDEESNNCFESELSETRGCSPRYASTSVTSPPPNLREIKLIKRQSIASSLSRSMRGLGLMIGGEDQSLTPEDQSQLSMNVQRKGEGYSPRKKKTGASLRSGGGDGGDSIPSGVVLKNGNADATSYGVISSMVKSFDESGSYKCAIYDDGDGERSVSIGDLSGFGLSQMGDVSSSSSFQS